MRIEFVWDGGDIDPADCEIIARQITTKGYCHIRCPVADEEVLKKLGSLIGPFQFHERSLGNEDRATDKDNAIARVTNEPRANPNPNHDARTFQGLSGGPLAPHSDGAYLEFTYFDENNVIRWVNPPAIILLQCINPAAVGGDSELIDGAKIIGDAIHDDQMYEYLTGTEVKIRRGKYTTHNLNFFRNCRNGNFAFRFRDKVIHSKSDEDRAIFLLERFIAEYLLNPEYKESIPLKTGDILVIDNLRMLHARTAFSCENNSFRVFNRLWVADRWGNIATARANPLLRIEHSEVAPRVEDDLVANYRWAAARTGQARRRYPIEPSLGIRLPGR